MNALLLSPLRLLSTATRGRRSSRARFARWVVAPALVLGCIAPAWGQYSDSRFPEPLRPITGSSELPLMPRSEMPRLNPKLIFYPPNPPPLGVALELAQPAEVLSRAPTQLAPYVTEPFYAPLSTFISPVVRGHLNLPEMSEREQRMLARFAQLRATLLTELRTQIVELTHADRATRLREFIDLAARQSAGLGELEELGEDLRDRFARKLDWSEFREWRLRGSSDDVAGTAYWLEQQVVRAAAYYQDGLSPEQRRLLREIAMELEEEVFLPGDGSAALFTYFLPDTARVRFPRDLPSPLAALLAQFRERKAALKSELRRTVAAHDASMDATRVNALRRLATEQADGFVEVEKLAEDIRSALARAGAQRLTAPPDLPADLATRIERFQTRRRSVDDYAVPEDMQREFEELERRVQLVTGAWPDISPDASGNASFARFLQKRQEAIAYHEYDIAVLEPGLSPEQRRLLFSGAIETLGLPLPGAEKQPTSVPGTLMR